MAHQHIRNGARQKTSKPRIVEIAAGAKDDGEMMVLVRQYLQTLTETELETLAGNVLQAIRDEWETLSIGGDDVQLVRRLMDVTPLLLEHYGIAVYERRFGGAITRHERAIDLMLAHNGRALVTEGLMDAGRVSELRELWMQAKRRKRAGGSCKVASQP